MIGHRKVERVCRPTEHRTSTNSWMRRSEPHGAEVDKVRYPKPVLHLRFWSDGLFHCKSLLPFCWLPAGARYVYVERVSAEDVLLSWQRLFPFVTCQSAFFDGNLQYIGDEGTQESVASVAIGPLNFRHVHQCTLHTTLA